MTKQRFQVQKEGKSDNLPIDKEITEKSTLQIPVS